MNPYEQKRKAQGYHCPGIGGSSKSSTASNDNRVTAGAVGISGSGNTVTDAGIVSRGLDTVDLSIANLDAGYQNLIEAANEIFSQGQGLIGKTQSAVADAYGQAQNDKAGAIDNRTILVLGIAGAVVAGVYFMNRRKG